MTDRKKRVDEEDEDDEKIEFEHEVNDFDLEHDDAEPDDRRRDPLRRP